MLTIERSLNIYAAGIPQIISLSQYDDDFRLVFSLYTSEGEFTIPSGTTAEVMGTKVDGNGYSASASISGSTVTVTGNKQMTACAGRNVYEIVLTQSGKRLATVNFILKVERAALDADTIQSETVLKELNAIIDSAATATEAAETATAAAESAAESARTMTIDPTLTQSGQAADAKATGDAIAELQDEFDSFEGISEDVKVALLNCFERVMWIDDTSGQSAYDDLYSALYGHTPTIEPSYDLRNIGYEVGGGGPSDIYTWTGSTKTLTGYRLFGGNDMTNRARMRTFMPAVSGTITAMPGYEIVAYLFDSIQFASSWDTNPKTAITNKFGNSGAVNFNSSYPAWVQSYTIEDSDCKYILLCFRKTDNTDWTPSELQNMYGTVFTASLSPTYKLFDIAEYTGGHTYTEGDPVKQEEVTEIGFEASHVRKYVKEVTANARAVSGFLPITNGILRSANSAKYQLCVYQINNIGQIMWDKNNPYLSAENGNPAWANEFNLSNSMYKNDIFCVCISFKKLDGTNFTADELANMYGTVFTYSEGE